MKLNQTLKEITTSNSKLTDTKFKISREYFELRLRNDRNLSNLRITQIENRKDLAKKIDEMKNISLQNINANIAANKKLVSQENVTAMTEKVYNDMISRFSYNITPYYENNKSEIIYYIRSVFDMRLAFQKYASELNEELKSFIREKSINTYVLQALVSLYNELKRDLSTYNKKCKDIDDFKRIQQEKEELSVISEEIFLQEVENINSRRAVVEIHNQIIEEELFVIKSDACKLEADNIYYRSPEFAMSVFGASRIDKDEPKISQTRKTPEINENTVYSRVLSDEQNKEVDDDTNTVMKMLGFK